MVEVKWQYRQTITVQPSSAKIQYAFQFIVSDPYVRHHQHQGEQDASLLNLL